MGLFNNINLSNEEKYGQAWLDLANQDPNAIKTFKNLDNVNFIEGTVALAMFTQDQSERKRLIKKAADRGNPEALWEYTGFIKHSYGLDLNDANDRLWLDYCTKAAKAGSADAMNELGNVYHRMKKYPDSMYWYMMADAYDHKDGAMSMAGLAREWSAGKKPVDTETLSMKDAKCAVEYLRIYSGEQLSI